MFLGAVGSPNYCFYEKRLVRNVQYFIYDFAICYVHYLYVLQQGRALTLRLRDYEQCATTR